jgi:hypothetical protein
VINAMDRIKDAYTTGGLKGALTEMGTIAKQGFESIDWNAVGTTLGNAIKAGLQAVLDIGNWLASLDWKSVGQKIGAAIGKALTSSFGGEVDDADLEQKVMDTFRNIGIDAIKIGVALIKGIIEGIYEGIPGLKPAVDAIKNALSLPGRIHDYLFGATPEPVIPGITGVPLEERLAGLLPFGTAPAVSMGAWWGGQPTGGGGFARQWGGGAMRPGPSAPQPPPSAFGPGGAPIPSAPTGTTGERAKAIGDMLTSLGVSPAGRAGFLGSLQQESGTFNPTEVYAGHVGIAQWGGERLTQLRATEGEKANTLEGQVDFLKKELQGQYSNVLASLQKATTVEQGARVATEKYEIPAIPGTPASEAEVAHRTQRGQAFLQMPQAEGKPVQVTGGPPVSGSVDVTVTHRNPPPGVTVAAKGTGDVNVASPRIEQQQLQSI